MPAWQFIYISVEEMEAVAAFIRRKGRVAITELAAKSDGAHRPGAQGRGASRRRGSGRLCCRAHPGRGSGMSHEADRSPGSKSCAYQRRLHLCPCLRMDVQCCIGIDC